MRISCLGIRSNYEERGWRKKSCEQTTNAAMDRNEQQPRLQRLTRQTAAVAEAAHAIAELDAVIFSASLAGGRGRCMGVGLPVNSTRRWRSERGVHEYMTVGVKLSAQSSSQVFCGMLRKSIYNCCINRKKEWDLFLQNCAFSFTFKPSINNHYY